MFVIRQVQASHPIMDVRLFKSNRTFTLSSLAAFINYGATTSVVFLLSLYLQYLKGLSPRSAGLLLVIAPVMQAVTSPIAGRLSDRIEPQRLASAGMGLTVLGLLMLIPLHSETALSHLLLCLFILGLGFGLFSSPNTNAIMSAVERRNYGIASAMVSAMRLLGQMFSMGFATLVLNHFVGRQAITPQVHPQFQHSMQAIFTVAAAVCFVGVFASLARGKLRTNN
jgi:MFS family permease